MAAAEEPPPLSRRIREERERLEISQEEAARRLHLSLKGYTAYERFREPKPSRAREIAVAFGLPNDHFETRRDAASQDDDQIVARLEALEAQVGELARAETVDQGFAALEAAIDALAERLSPPNARRK